MVARGISLMVLIAIANASPYARGDAKSDFDQIHKSLRDDQNRYYSAIQTAQSRSPEQAAMKLKPKTEDYLKRFYDAIRARPDAREGLSAINWVVVSSPGSFEADECFKILIDHHLNDPRLPALIAQVGDWPTRAAKEFLKEAAEKSTVRETRGLAKLVLGNILAGEARSGLENAKDLREEARELLKSVSADYSNLTLKEGKSYEELARSLLAKLDRPAEVGTEVGDRAPRIDGTDVDGERLRLSDTNGSVRAIVIWAHWCMWCHDVYEFGRSLKNLSGSRELVLLGINGDGDPNVLNQVIKNEKITWQNWPLASNPAIAESYPTNRYPTTLIVDQNGMVRYRSLGGVDALSIVQAASTLKGESKGNDAKVEDGDKSAAPQPSNTKKKKRRTR